MFIVYIWEIISYDDDKRGESKAWAMNPFVLNFTSDFRILLFIFLSDPSPIIGNACHSLTD